jgi:hypothetical protein
MEICIFEIDAGYPMPRAEKPLNGCWSFHFELLIFDEFVQRLEIENWSKAAVLLGYYKEGTVVPESEGVDHLDCSFV